MLMALYGKSDSKMPQVAHHQGFDMIAKYQISAVLVVVS